VAVHTENLCILLTDIAGYTERSTTLSREQMERLLSRHNELLLPLVRAFKGRHVKSIGDALLLTFKSPTDAMLCAMAMQDRLHEYNTGASSAEQIHIRIAASLGEVRVTKSDIFGDPVNLTSRIEAITPVDEVYLSEAVYLAMNKAEVPVREVGLKELKGIGTPVRIFCIPRFTTNRLVPESVVPSGSSVEFPYGGAHVVALARVSSAGAWMGKLPTPGRRWITGGAVAAGVVLLIGLGFGLNTVMTGGAGAASAAAPRSVDPVAPPAVAAVESPAPVVAQVAASLLLQTPAPGSPGGVNPVEAGAGTPVAAVAATPAAAAGAAALAGGSTVLAANVQPAQPVVKPRPQYRNIRGTKEAYRQGRITKDQYRSIVRRLEAELDARIESLQMSYRAGRINKQQYKERVRQLKLAYE